MHVHAAEDALALLELGDLLTQPAVPLALLVPRLGVVLVLLLLLLALALALVQALLSLLLLLARGALGLPSLLGLTEHLTGVAVQAGTGALGER